MLSRDDLKEIEIEFNNLDSKKAIIIILNSIAIILTCYCLYLSYNFIYSDESF